MKNYLYLCLLALFLNSCKNVHEKKLKMVKKSVVFNVGFPSWRIKYFQDKEKEYIAFSDFRTHKEASINKLDGSQLFIVSFKQAMKEMNSDFYSFDAINLDTFVLLSKYTNKIAFINKVGNILYKKDFSKLLLKGYTLYPPFNINGGNIYSCLDWGPTNIDSISDTVFCKLKHEGAHLMVARIKDTTNSFKLTLDSIYNRFAKDNETTLETPNLIIKDNQIIFSSIFTDSLYVFSTNSLKLDTIIKVNSKYYPIDFRPITLDYTRKHSNATLRTGPISKHSMITDIKYDEINQILYCTVSGPIHDNKYANFSIIVFDKNFNKLYEKLFKNTNLDQFSFVGKEGLYIRNKGDDLKRTTYTLFRYE